ncbi:MAG: efflux RND transporter periplasmic adaptor subunit [Candidatus Krumholzibacteria bacterium]|nr:efflux RND transporter periplasmic adaptor subunit [Candidatus Krumholzibacteria bacterium]
MRTTAPASAFMSRTAAIALLLAFHAAWSAGCSDTEQGAAGSGLIETDEVIVSAEAAGRVMERFFREGDELSEGDVLLAMDSTRIVLQIRAAEASLAAARANLETAKARLAQARQTESFAGAELDRVSRLLGGGSASARQHDKAQFEYDSAVKARLTAEAAIAAVGAEIEKIRAETARLEREREDTRPRSPLSGIVLETYVEAGELLSPGRPIAMIADIDTVSVKVYLGARAFAGVALGDPAVVDTESGGRSFAGTVVWTSDEAEFTPKNVQTKESRSGLVYAVKVLVPNPDRTLKVGMPVYVTIQSK